MKRDKLIFELSNLLSNLQQVCHERDIEISDEFGISVSELQCLRLFLDENLIGIKELIHRLRVSHSRLSRILDGLEQKGIITRSINLKDHRNIQVALTEKGIEVIEKIRKYILDKCQPMMERIPEESTETTIHLLKDLLNSYLGTSSDIKDNQFVTVHNTMCDGGKKI